MTERFVVDVSDHDPRDWEPVERPHPSEYAEDRGVCECNGGEECDCPDCDHPDCSYQQPDPEATHEYRTYEYREGDPF